MNRGFKSELRPHAEHPMDETGRVWEWLLYLGHVGEPLQDLVHTGKVIMRHRVGHSIVIHDLYAPQLVVARVHLSSQHLHMVNPQVMDLSSNFISVHLSLQHLHIINPQVTELSSNLISVHLSPQHLHIVNPQVTNLSHHFISVHGKMTGNRPFVEFYLCTPLTSTS